VRHFTCPATVQSAKLVQYSRNADETAGRRGCGRLSWRSSWLSHNPLQSKASGHNENWAQNRKEQVGPVAKAGRTENLLLSLGRISPTDGDVCEVRLEEGRRHLEARNKG